MEQTRSLNALEPYIALSKSATAPRAAADLITQATSAPQTYVFAELLQTPNIQALRNSQEYGSHLRLLEIFCWGTLTDYKASSGLPHLSQAQQDKLLQLSLLPLCTKPTTLSYDVLQSNLFPDSTPDDLQLESLIRQAIYASLINAHLDPLNRVVRVTSTAPLRDLAPNSVPEMLTTLAEWEARCSSTLAEIEAQIAGIRTKARDEKSRNTRREVEAEDAVAQSSEAANKKNANKGDDNEGSHGLNTRSSRHDNGGANKLEGIGSKIWDSMTGRGGKRAAGGYDGVDEDEDIMDLDDGPYDMSDRSGAGRRGAKRGGRSGLR